MAISQRAGHPQSMLTEAYIEALLIDSELADQVWCAWVRGLIDDELATIAWLLIAISSVKRLCRTGQNLSIYLRPLGSDREL